MPAAHDGYQIHESQMSEIDAYEHHIGDPWEIIFSS